MTTARVLLYVTEAAQRHGVTADAVLGRDRKRRVAHARFEVMRRLRADGWSLTQIGRALGRHHTTVLHGLAAPAPGRWWA